jgi:putative iron-dependent peroxidase
MNAPQPGILAPIPPLARHLVFSLQHDADLPQGLDVLGELVDGESTVVGIGPSLAQALAVEIEGLRVFPQYAGAGFDVPSTPAALWCWLRGEDRGELVHRTRRLERALVESFSLDSVIDAFNHGPGRDLTGYEDGTENPVGQEAVKAAIVQGQREELNGSSFVAVQQWIHDLDAFEAMSTEKRDHTIGRRISDNEELKEAPASAHVKRTAQEDFDPQAFVVRRSMPWADEAQQGLVFVAFGHSLDAYAALLQRMVGADDGIPDALFSFTRPISGAYFWCPPLRDGRLYLKALKR